MARKFYGFDGQGKVILERRAGHPSSFEQGRVYSLSGVPYFDTGSAQQKLIKEDGGTYAIAVSGAAGDASTLDGQNGAYYTNSSNQDAGTLPSARLSGTYNISISGTAANATQLNSQAASYYLDLGNATGTLAAARLSGTYNIDITGTARYG